MKNFFHSAKKTDTLRRIDKSGEASFRTPPRGVDLGVRDNYLAVNFPPVISSMPSERYTIW